MNNGWTHPDPVSATKEIICPVSGGLICMILLPAMVCRALQYFVPFLAMDDKFICGLFHLSVELIIEFL